MTEPTDDGAPLPSMDLEVELTSALLVPRHAYDAIHQACFRMGYLPQRERNGVINMTGLSIEYMAADAPMLIDLDKNETEECRRWFMALVELGPTLLDRTDYELGKRLHLALGEEVPREISERLRAPSEVDQNPEELLVKLTRAMDGAMISTWQSNGLWTKELDAARRYCTSKGLL